MWEVRHSHVNSATVNDRITIVHYDKTTFIRKGIFDVSRRETVTLFIACLSSLEERTLRPFLGCHAMYNDSLVTFWSFLGTTNWFPRGEHNRNQTHEQQLSETIWVYEYR